MKNLSFPIIRKIVIENFSLYKRKDKISIELKGGVFCLAGANGLGKSTFLNIVNYGLTGIVKRPDSLFSQAGSIPQFYSKNKTFAASYFDRRITESLRELASVEIIFEVRGHLITVGRNFFENDSISKLSITRNGEIILDTTDLSPSDLDAQYKQSLTELIGLTDFDQFVFLQFFVLTFDESHQLVFWDNSLMERVLYLFFNLDSSKAKRADQLRKEISAHESNMRNLQWDATQKEKELTNIVNQMDVSPNSEQDVNEDAIEDYRILSANLAEQHERIQNLEAELKECDLQLADYSLKVSVLRNDYNVLFNSSFNKDLPIEKDPKIVTLLNEIRKKVCAGEEPAELLIQLKQIIWQTKCVQAVEPDSEALLTQLQTLDEEIFKLTNEEDKIQKRKARLIGEFENTRKIANEIKSALEQIEASNENFLVGLYKKSGNPDMSALVANMRNQINALLANKSNESAKRDSSRGELRKLEKELNRDYLTAEETFMPMFIDYARNFLGLDINIYLQTYSKGATLILEVNDSERREKHQLSESQRYFIDIALRMALIEYSSTNALMLIDTPEGSLDIAYESRAGKMFADFSHKGYNLLLTANINSSMLLKQLAQQCGASGMQLERMTDWTNLSEVQQQEQTVIDRAFSEIEQLLN